MIKGDYDTAYGFLSPGSKDGISLDVYKRKIKQNIWRDVELAGPVDEAVKCEDQACKIELFVTIDYKTMHGLKTPVWESWVLENGNAWYVYR